MQKEEDSNQESLLTFPVDFPIKVMGLARDDFPSTIGALVQLHAPDFKPETIQIGHSKTGKYMALTVTVHATSRVQLDSLYKALTSHPMVKIVI